MSSTDHPVIRRNTWPPGKTIDGGGLAMGTAAPLKPDASITQIRNNTVQTLRTLFVLNFQNFLKVNFFVESGQY
ncbi:MAG: hypothetical protein OIF57_02640 [Marinobacterium sp.]|nr:hypothetical protein [Marinobacterium sp.]